ncbi:MAG TPA: ribonuclease D [Actinomycetota bacterium]|nr:ribonuclease D [Actinomycetota bacterium]
MRPEPPSEVIRDQGSLDRMVAGARAAGRFGIDTEFMRERTYRARLCLVQLNVAGTIVLVDPLEEVDLAPLADLIAAPEVEVILHAGRQDLELFYERFGAVPQRVFDVQIAAGFAGFGSSLSYGRLVESVLGAKIEKGESYTDWCRRPLSDAQLAYAADDVRYLIDAADALERELAEKNRLDSIRAEMAALEREETFAVDPERAYLRVGGRGALSGKQLGILREIARWREETASRRDVPRGWIVKDQTLIEIARRQPGSLDALKDVRGMNAKEAERSGRAILAAIKAGREGGAIEKGRAPSRSAQARVKMISGMVDALIRARCEAADVATDLVATRAEVEAVLLDLFAGTLDESKHRVLQEWRRDLVGDAILGLARGRIGLRAIDRPPYVEEVDVHAG